MNMDSNSLTFFVFMALCLLLFLGISLYFIIKAIRINARYLHEIEENDRLTELLAIEHREKEKLLKQIELVQQTLEQKEKTIDTLKEKGYEEVISREQKLALLKQEIAQLTNDKESIKREWELFKAHSQEKIDFLQQSEARLTHQFESLTQKMVSHSQDALTKQSEQQLTTLLSPLKEQLFQFNQQLNERLTDETKERFALKYEISQLHTLNQRLAEEAINLTNALKSNNKIQGNWGEMILLNLLDSVGFTKGREYTIQSQFQTDEHKRLIPDVIVNLPENKQVIIDSKVSLIAFENYYHAKDKQESELALKALIASIKNHMKELSEKQYHSLKGINSLDYVLMFIPIEAAFILAVGEADNLLAQAQKQNIMLVSPSTLFVALRTIQQLWRSEYKNQNATDIALKASKLYDKFRLFLEDFQSVGLHIQRVEQSYQNAFNKLSLGKGNLIQQVEGFRTLGVDVKKPIPTALVEESLYEQSNSNETHNSESYNENTDSSELLFPSNVDKQTRISLDLEGKIS